MWIKLIVSLVAFGALIQSGLTCPSQCSCSGTTVNCDSKRFTTVPAGIPSNTQNLYLGNNQITKLEPGVFDSLTQLTVLYLHENQLSALPAGVFDRLVNLKDLSLSGNKLTALPPGVFDKLTQLTAMGLNDNQLKTVPKGAFDNLKSLTGIWLHDNPWDCQCTDIHYLSGWTAQHAGIVGEGWPWRHSPDSVKCSGTNKPVRSITAAETSPEKCPGYVKPTTTTAMPTTTTPEIIPTTEPVTTAVTPKPTAGVKLNCTGIVQRSDRPGDCGNPACHTLMNCANFMSCLCASCAICQKRR